MIPSPKTRAFTWCREVVVAPFCDGSKQMNVLVVDDEESIRTLMQVALAHEEGVDAVRVAQNGQDAIRLVEDFKPDVIVLDYWMPGMDGSAVAYELRRRLPDVRIVAFSGVLQHTPDWADAFFMKGDMPDLQKVIHLDV